MTPILRNVAEVLLLAAASVLAGLLVFAATMRYFERKARRAREREAARMEPQ